LLISVAVHLMHVSMQADLCFDAATEGAGEMLVCHPPVVAAK